MTSASGLPVQRQARKPGEQYAAIVAQDWVPSDQLVVVASRLGAFVAMSPDETRTIERSDLGAVTGAYYRARALPYDVTVTCIARLREGSLEMSEAQTVPPPHVPAEWFAEVRQTLLDHSAGLIAAAERETVSTRKRDRMSRKLITWIAREEVRQEDAGTLTTSEYWRAGVVVVHVKRERRIIARLFPDNGLLVADEQRYRRAAAEQLTEDGFALRLPLRGWDEPPPARMILERVEAWGPGCCRISILTPDDEPKAIAYCFTAAMQVIVASDVLVPAVEAFLAWHGLPAMRRVHVSPPGSKPLLSSTAFALEYPVLSDLMKAGAAWDNDLTRRRYGDPEGLQILSVDERARVPTSVANFFDDWIRTKPLDGYSPDLASGFLHWTHRTPVLTDLQVQSIANAVNRVALPPEATQVMAHAKARYSRQPLLMAAIALRREAPDWWTGLPWANEKRIRKGAIRQANGTVGDFALQELVQEMDSEEAQRTGQPALVALLKNRSLPVPDLPRGLDQDDQGRLYLAAAALAQAGFGQVGADPEARDGKCIVCGRVFHTSSLYIPLLLFAETDRICRACVEAAQGYNRGGLYRPGLDEQAALDSLRALAERAGSIPAREVLRASGRADSDDELVTEVLLRIAAPWEGGWVEWLERAGLLTDGWRPAFGTYSTATDGHPCRSMLERYIDDWMFSEGIAHSLEPAYPFDLELNPNGAIRADWLVDGAFVEAAGLMERAEYAAKMLNKRKLADKYDLRLLIVAPADIVDLRHAFAKLHP